MRPAAASAHQEQRPSRPGAKQPSHARRKLYAGVRPFGFEYDVTQPDVMRLLAFGDSR